MRTDFNSVSKQLWRYLHVRLYALSITCMFHIITFSSRYSIPAFFAVPLIQEKTILSTPVYRDAGSSFIGGRSCVATRR